MADRAGPTMHTEVQRPARTIFCLPNLFTSTAMRGSSQVFMLVRSMTLCSGKTDLISSKIGPEKLFSATVVRMVETLNSLAALATRAALLRRVTASMDLVAKDICDWWSIMIRVWSVGLSRVLPGTALAMAVMVGFLVAGVERKGGFLVCGVGCQRWLPESVARAGCEPWKHDCRSPKGAEQTGLQGHFAVLQDHRRHVVVRCDGVTMVSPAGHLLDPCARPVRRRMMQTCDSAWR